MCNFDTDIGTEELVHLEMVSTIIYQLTKGLSMEGIEKPGLRRPGDLPAEREVDS